MKSDTQLWKLARNQWHLLLIQGMLMEHDSKKVFAKVSGVYGGPGTAG